MFRHDLVHTGYNPDETQLKPPLRLKWSYTTGGAVGSSPAVVEGVVYVGSNDAKVYALESARGALRWSYTTGAGVTSSPAVADGAIYVGSFDGKVYALEAATGALRWSYTTGDAVGSSPAVADGMVYVGSQDGKVYAMEAATGALRWSYTTGDRVGSSPAVVEGVVYVGSNDAKVYALESATGALRWSYTTGGVDIVHSSPAVANGVVYVGSAGGTVSPKVRALEAATGALRWSYTTGGVDIVHSSPAVANGVVFVGGSAGGVVSPKVYAFDAATGSLRWSYTTGAEGIVHSSPAVANGVVYVGSNNNKVYALDANTGALLWSYTTGGGVVSSPVVANGVVYVGSNDGKVYAFEGQPPPVTALLPAYANSAFPISWTVPITWTGTPAASYDVQYRDGASGSRTDWITSTTITSTTFSGQDGHTYYFQARARAAAGAIGDWSDTTSITVDLTPPTGRQTVQGWSSLYISNAVTLSVAASDATSGLSQMQFGSDGLTFGAWETYTTTRSYVAPPGATAVYGRFKDGAGNISQPVTGSITLDASPPEGSLQTQGWSSPNLSNSVALSVSASDATSGLSQMQLSSDGVSYSEWEPYASSKTYVLPAGSS